MSISTLVRTTVISNPTAGEFRFEIYQDEDAHFYADISRKNSNGAWESLSCGYGFKRASDIDEAVNGCIKYVDNLEIDLNAIESKK